MINSDLIQLNNGMLLDDYLAVEKTYIDTIRANKSIGRVAMGLDDNLFREYTGEGTNGKMIVVNVPSSFSSASGNGCIGIGTYGTDLRGITLAPNLNYRFDFTLLTTCNHDALFEVGYLYRTENEPESVAKHNARRAVMNALRKADGSIYAPSPAILTKNNVATIISSTFTVSGGSGYPWDEKCIVPYICAEFPDFDGTSGSRLVLNGWRLGVTAYPRWSM